MGEKIDVLSALGITTDKIKLWTKQRLNDMNSKIADGFSVSDGKLYLSKDGEVISDGIDLPSGGGGGGSASSAILTFKNTSGWTYKAVASGADCIITGTWSSIEDSIPTGDGVITINVNNSVKYNANIPQGDFTINVGSYLSPGSNTIKISVVDRYGTQKSISLTVDSVELVLDSTFDPTIVHSGDIEYVYTPISDVEKTVFFILDGKQIGTETVLTSGRQQTYIINAQPHGSHTLEVYYTAMINEETVESNHLYYDLICIESGYTASIISCTFNNTQISQYETINIPYTVYNPTSLTSDIILKQNDTIVSELSVDRTEKTWVYRADSAGEIVLSIICGETVKEIRLSVAESDINIQPVTNNLDLYLSSYGRSNDELNPAQWVYKDVECSFTNYNWLSDGWQTGDDGYSVHRVTGDARLTIPLKIFSGDFRTTGKTIEIEFSTKDVLDYDSTIISCFSNNIGLKLTAQQAILKSQQSEISTQYKEGEHIRISFVVEKRVENRLIFIYLNGIMCGATQYPTDDDFAQSNPVDIVIGSNDCTIDIYNIRVYNNNLTRYQILDNWIADTQDVIEKVKRYNHNDVYDAYGTIVIPKLPNDLPYLILEGEQLPQYKGNKLTISGSYTDPVNSQQSFTFENAQIDVQGTSSSGYARKNYKIKFKNGIIQNGEQKDGYQLRGDDIPANVFTFKADVASSEGANNVELVRLYNDTCTYKTPPQITNKYVRQGIDGFPIVIFHNDGESIKFVGKYNFNNDKSSEEIFGFSDGDESWEILNNTSDRVLWKSADFSGDGWKNDFEARYPEDNVDISNLQRFAEWVVSTDRDQATNSVLDFPVTYNDVEYTTDSKEYRLAKFRAEIGNYAEIDSALFYYLFTEIFLMIDSRAKNAFPSLIGGDRIIWLPYDFDTAIGIDNSGSLKFGYELEDIDTVDGGADVYNGQKSIFWCNIRDAFNAELSSMYQELRSNNKISYNIVEKAYEEHQAVWPEAIWNEDAYYKYLEPLIEDGSGIYLPMLQGSKSEQRKWWLYNRFRYIDSKYYAGDSLKDFITLRGYAKSDITVEPYADIYANIKYGSYMVQKRALRGDTYTLECPLDNVNDTEIYIYSASQLKSVGDLSGLKVGLADFSMATKLQSLKIGDSSPDYFNGNLKSLTLGNNVLLHTLDARNCPNLGSEEQQTIDISGCTNIENIYLTGTSIKSINLPDGGILKTLYLPDTISNLKICNQQSLSDFYMPNYSNITSLRLENVGSIIDTIGIINNINEGSRIRLIGIDWTVDTVESLNAIFNKLSTMRGLDENDNNLNSAVISGRIRVNESVPIDVINNYYSLFPEIVIDDGSNDIYIVQYRNWDGTVLYTLRLSEGEDAIDPIEAGYIDAPTRPSDDSYSYQFIGWNSIPTNVKKHTVVIANYNTNVAVNFYVDGEKIYSAYVVRGNAAQDPIALGKIDVPTKTGTDDLHYVFDRWDNLPTNVQKPTTVNAVFANVYPVRFYATSDSPTPLYSQWVKEGEDSYDPIQVDGWDVPVDIMVVENEQKLVYVAWDNLPTGVSGICQVYATYDTYWAVKFYNESIMVDLQWIKNGGDAVNPITREENPIATPTKVSTAQYDYVFLKWDISYTNITNVTNVYAVYNSITRKYTVKFYNIENGENVLLHTQENVPYGTDAKDPIANGSISTPTKLGVEDSTKYDFTGWNPSYKNIQGDTECFAMFRYNSYLFGELSDPDNPDWTSINSYWTQINNDINALNNNEITNDAFNQKYPIGGRMLVPFTLSDGVEYTADVEIIAYNHDNLADSSGKAPLTFLCKDLPDFQKKIYDNTNNINYDGWSGSDLRTFLNGELFNALPDELKAVIKPVYKISDGGANNKALVTTTDYCWIPSYDEAGFEFNRTDNIPGQGERYAETFGFGSDGNYTRIKYTSDGYTSGRWWLRTTSYGESIFMLRVQDKGGVQPDGLWNKYYVAFGFCIGSAASITE